MVSLYLHIALAFLSGLYIGPGVQTRRGSSRPIVSIAFDILQLGGIATSYESVLQTLHVQCNDKRRV